MVLVLAVTPGLLGGAEPTAEEGLKTTFGPDGLASLSYQGKELLVKGPAWARYTTNKPDGTPATFSEDQHEKVDGGTITRTYEGLTTVTAIRQEKDTLRMELAFENTRGLVLTDIGFRPFAVQFPRRPKGARWKWGYTVTTNNEGEPGIVVEDHVAEMADKIAYAKRRWGCTSFYMDTNVKWEKGMWSRFYETALAAWTILLRSPSVDWGPCPGVAGGVRCGEVVRGRRIAVGPPEQQLITRQLKNRWTRTPAGVDRTPQHRPS
jgi:hypothetical protein